MALPRGYQLHLPTCTELVEVWRGQNCFFFAILGGVKYKFSVFGFKAKMKPTKYPYGLLRE